RLVEASERLLLLRSEVDRRLHLDTAEQIAVTGHPHGPDALALHSEYSAGLSLGRDLQLDVPVECRHLDRAAEGGVREADRHLAGEVLTFASKNRMRLHGDVDVQIARRPAVAAGFAFARQPNAVAVVDARRHLHGQRPDLAHDARARAIGTRLLDTGARAAARGARLLYGEEPLLHADIAVTAACRARDTLRAGCRARAFTRLARDAARDLDLDGVARDGLLERELELVAQVRAAVHLRAA